jgi:hypothetical protein
MKRLILFLLLVCLTTLVFADITGNPRRIFEQSIGTNQHGYDISRTVSTNDTSLAATTKTWDAIDSVFHAIPSSWSNVTISFYAYGDGTGAGSPDNGTFDFAIYTARAYGGAILVCSQNDATIGACQLSHVPNSGVAGSLPNTDFCWMDTCSVTDTWPTDVAEGNNGGGDEIAEVCFDPLGSRGIYIIVNDMTNVTSVTYVISGFGG